MGVVFGIIELVEVEEILFVYYLENVICLWVKVVGNMYWGLV